MSRLLSAPTCRFLLAAFAALLAPAALSQTCSTEWINPAGGVWDTPANWTNGVPGSSSTACITLDGTYTVQSGNADRALAGLVVGGASGVQTLTSSGVIGISGNSAVRPNGRWRLEDRAPGGGDGLYVPTGTLTVEGEVAVTGGVSFLTTGGTLDVAPGGVFRPVSGAGVGAASALFRIRGLLEASCPPTSYGFCEVDARVEVDGGTIRVVTPGAEGRLDVRAGGLMRDATVDAAAGTTLFLADVVVAGGAPFVLSGTVSGSPAGIVYWNGVDVTAAPEGATLAMGGTGFQLSGSSHLKSAGGAFRNTGLLVHAETGSNFAGIDGATLRNEGRFLLPGRGFGFLGGGVVRNEATGIIEIANGGGLAGVGGGDGRVENAGLIVHTANSGPGTGTTGRIGVPYTGLPGSILRTETGRLDLLAGGSFRDVTFDVPAGTEMFVAGSAPYEVLGTLSGTPAGTLYASGTSLAAGADGATLAFGGTGLQLSGSTFLTSAGGGFVNTGLLRKADTGSNFSGFRAVTVVNQATVDFASFQLLEGAVLRNEAGATLLLPAGGSLSGDGRLENAGLILREGNRPGVGGTYSFGGLLHSLPGSEIRSNEERVDLAGPGAQTVPEGTVLTGTGRFGVGRDLDIQGTVSPGTAEQPLARLEFQSAYIPSAVAGAHRLVVDLDTGGRSDTLDVLFSSGAVNVRLAGTVVARVRPGYLPAAGDTFTILTSARVVEGAFGDVIVENAEGAVFVTETAPDGLSVVLRATQAVASESGPDGAPEALAFAVATLSSPSARPSVRVTLPEAMALAVEVYDVQGRRVAVLAAGERASGVHALPVGGLAPGVYVARIVAVGPSGAERATQRLVVVR